MAVTTFGTPADTSAGTTALMSAAVTHAVALTDTPTVALVRGSFVTFDPVPWPTLPVESHLCLSHRQLRKRVWLATRVQKQVKCTC